jgi:hypothetical protein
MSLSLQDRATLIRLATNLPQGSEERNAILAGLRRFAYREPKEIHEVKDMDKLKRPLEFESRGNENIYFTDKYGDRWFFKAIGRPDEEKKILRYLTSSEEGKRAGRELVSKTGQWSVGDEEGNIYLEKLSLEEAKDAAKAITRPGTRFEEDTRYKVVTFPQIYLHPRWKNELKIHQQKTRARNDLGESVSKFGGGDRWLDRIEKDIIRLLPIEEELLDELEFPGTRSNIKGEEAELVVLRIPGAGNLVREHRRNIERFTNHIIDLDSDGDRMLIWVVPDPLKGKQASINWTPQTVARAKREGKKLVEDPETKDRMFHILTSEHHAADLTLDPAIKGDPKIMRVQHKIKDAISELRDVMNDHFIWD